MIWKDVIGYEGRYEVSDRGDVKSLSTKRRSSPIILKPFIDKDGYGTLKLFDGEKFKNVKIHRLVLSAFLGRELGKGLVVNHKDGIKLNNCLKNLEEVTSKLNNIHARENGLMIAQKGQDASRAKRSNQHIFNIKNDILSGMKTKEIAEKYSEEQSLISHIRAGRIWSSVTGFKKI